MPPTKPPEIRATVHQGSEVQEYDNRYRATVIQEGQKRFRQ